ncbi:hypothetical protein FE257_007181 [Aspergillus nanangensis]|uniref:Uncharacterized protein n=1 Tax=Aspergillus nanangensis TaxID=2582783 RepID=A0AAD4C9X4_ASPNN|nr:hypothetical protein FE257_007181 [Aspergillus nanangensis]
MLVNRTHLHSLWGKSRTDEEIYQWYVRHGITPPEVVTSRYAAPKPSSPLKDIGHQHLMLELLQELMLQAVKQCLAQIETTGSHLRAANRDTDRTANYYKDKNYKGKDPGGKQFTSGIPNDRSHGISSNQGTRQPSEADINELKLQRKLQDLIPQLLRA